MTMIRSTPSTRKINMSSNIQYTAMSNGPCSIRSLTTLYNNNYNKKAMLSQRRPRNAPHYGWPENFRDSLTMSIVYGYFSQNFSWASVLIHPMNVRTKFKVRSFTRSWDNRGTQKIWAVPRYAHATSSQKFLMDFSSDASYKRAKLEVLLYWVNRYPKIGAVPRYAHTRGGHSGSGMVPFESTKERWWVSIGRP